MVKRLRKKHIPSIHFVRVKKQKTVLEDLINVPVILEMKDGRFYGAYVDDYLHGGAIAVYECNRLSEDFISDITQYDTEKQWKDMSESEIFEYFDLKQIKNIYRAKDEDLALSEVLTLALNPLYKPIKGIECDWLSSGMHSKSCDNDLHEALSKIYTVGSRTYKSKKEYNKFGEDCEVIRRFIIENGGKIP